MNYQYAGIELNDDDIPDAVLINIVSCRKTFLMGDAGGGLSRYGVKHLSSEERAALPDMVTEADLDGDNVEDLIIGKLSHLRAAASQDDRTFMRVLEYSIYFGENGSTFRTWRFSALQEEQLKVIVQNAKSLLVPAD